MLEEEKKNGYENFLQEIIVKNFPNMGKEIVSQIQEAKINRINPRKNILRHILIKLTRYYKRNPRAYQ